MKLEVVKLSDLKPLEKNVRKHNDKQIDELVKSVEQFGQTRAMVIDEDNNILIGNGLYFALVKMNWLADIRLMKFGNNLILYLLASIVNSSALIALSIVIGEFTVLEYIGRNTMKVLVMHKFPVLFFQALVPITSRIIIQKSDTVVGCFMAIIIAIISTYMCIVVGNITEKIVPWLYGKK